MSEKAVNNVFATANRPNKRISNLGFDLSFTDLLCDFGDHTY
jgi:hypothetical protein